MPASAPAVESRIVVASLALVVTVALGACAPAPPLMPYSTDTPPLVLAPASEAGVLDQRARFRDIYCAVLEAGGGGLPDYRPCQDVLTQVGIEPASSGKPVDLGPSKRRLIAAMVGGIGYECFEPWLNPPVTVAQHVRRFGYDAMRLEVDALSGTENNARQIRDAIMAMPPDAGAPRLVLVGYSKGAPDILEAVVTYPEIRSRVAAMVSAAGAIGGSALANDAEQYQADLLRYFPGSSWGSGDGGAVASLQPAVRKEWLARNPLPREMRYYSLVTFPQPERISSLLTSSYDKLARIDARNDSQVIFYDQVVPGSTLLGYLDADHWAVAVPINRTHATIASMFVTQNAYPREALLEAVLRFVEEDLSTRTR
jgi:hypothetical protein